MCRAISLMVFHITKSYLIGWTIIFQRPSNLKIRLSHGFSSIFRWARYISSINLWIRVLKLKYLLEIRIKMVWQRMPFMCWLTIPSSGFGSLITFEFGAVNDVDASMSIVCGSPGSQPTSSWPSDVTVVSASCWNSYEWLNSIEMCCSTVANGFDNINNVKRTKINFIPQPHRTNHQLQRIFQSSLWS